MVSVTSNSNKAPLVFSPKPQLSAANASAVALVQSSGSATSLLTGSVTSDKSAKPLTEQQQKDNAALNTVKQASSQKTVNSNRASQALDKLKQAKQRLQILRQFGGDPKAVAKQAKQIIQDIKAAASAYGEAIKNGGDASAAAPADASDGTSASDGANPPSPDTSTASANAAPDQSAPTAATVDATTTVEASSATDASASSVADSATDQSANTAAGTSTDATSDTEAQPATASPDVASDADSQKSADAAPDADAAFRQKALQAYQDVQATAQEQVDRLKDLQDFKDTANDAKSLIKESAQKLKAAHAADPDAADNNRAVADLDKEIQKLSDAVQTPQVNASGAGDAAAADATTTNAGDASPQVAASSNSLALNLIA